MYKEDTMVIIKYGSKWNLNFDLNPTILRRYSRRHFETKDILSSTPELNIVEPFAMIHIKRTNR